MADTSRPIDIVIIPCFRRPEFLFYCLDRIVKARGSGKHAYIFMMDYGYDKQIEGVISQFPYPKLMMRRGRSRYTDGKQSYNVLQGLVTAAYSSSRYVYLIEEDVLIATDFFEWHEQAHEQNPNLFCSLSTKNHNRAEVPSGGADQYYLTTEDYCSLGVCFRKEVIVYKISPHAKNIYYSSPTSYVVRTFPKSRFARGFSEQDGLIRRIQEQEGMAMPIAYPCLPRAYHCGFYGKNRKQKYYVHELNQRIEKVGKIIFDKEMMRQHSVEESYYQDSIPINLEINERHKFKRIG